MVLLSEAHPRASHSTCSGINVSFEFFPPQTEEMEADPLGLDQAARAALPRVRLGDLWRGRVDARAHACDGGAHSQRDDDQARRASDLRRRDLRARSTRIARDYWDMGVRHIVALRGDPQGGPGAGFVPHPQGYANSTALVAGFKKIADFEITVSAYPEGHPESVSIDHDIDVLKAKIDAGATRAITQFFFENDVYLRFLDKVQAHGIDIPIVPGIVPVQNFKQTALFARRAGASIPQWLADRFEGLDDDPTTRRLIAATVAAEQVFDLVDEGIDHFHFYTMNRADLVYAICHLLGLRPKP